MPTTLLVAELAQAHEGSLGLCYSLIDECIRVGVDVIKFQIHIASEESTYEEPFRVKGAGQDDCRYAYWKRMEFTLNQWIDIVAYVQRHGLKVMISPFSPLALEYAVKCGVDFIKIGSGEATNNELLELCYSTAKPIVISTGLINRSELSRLLANSLRFSSQTIFCHCVSEYPTSAALSKLSLIHEFENEYGIKFGLSDHSGQIAPSMYAIAHQLPIVEFHVTFSKSLYGFDAQASLDFSQVKEVVEVRNFLEEALLNDHFDCGDNKQMRLNFGRSVALKTNKSAGYIIKEEDLCLKKPGGFIPAEEKYNLIGRSLLVDYDSKHILKNSDFSS